MSKNNSSIQLYRDQGVPAKWHYFYFILALFCIFTILSALYVNRVHLRQYAQIIDSNRKTAEVLNDLSKLHSLAGDVNAPGNDIFNSRNISSELHRYQIANSIFDHSFNKLKMNNKQERQIVIDIENNMNEMRREATLLFNYYKKNNLKNAASQMAQMDQKYTKLLHSIEELKDKKIKQQTDMLDQHHLFLEKSQRIEYLFAFLVIVMIVGISLYGSKMSSYVSEKAAQEKLRIEQLEIAQKLAKIGSWELDIQNKYMNWSQEQYKIYEVEEPQSPEDLYKIYQKRIHPDDFDQLEKKFTSASQKREGFKIIHRLLFDDGKIKHVQLIGTHLSRNKSLLTGTCQDISLQQLAQDEKTNIARITKLFNSIDRAIMNSHSFYGLIQNILDSLTQDEKWPLAAYWEIDTNDNSYFKLLGIKTYNPNRFSHFISRTRELNLIDRKTAIEELKNKQNFSGIKDLNSSNYFLNRHSSHIETDWPQRVLPIIIYQGNVAVGVLEVISEKTTPSFTSFEQDFLDLGSRISQARERILEKDKILKEQARFQRLMEGLDTSAIVSIANSKGEITYVNQMFSEITGYSKEELLGKNHRIIKSGQHNKEFFQEMWKTLLKNNIWQGEICNRKKNGEYYWVSSVITPSTDENGQPQYTSIRFDITERKQMEQRIKSNEELLKFALEGAGDGVWDWNVPQNTYYFSKNWKEMLGHSEEEIGTSSDELLKRIHPEDLPLMMAKITEHFTKHRPYNHEFRMSCKDLSYKWILSRGMVVARDKDGNPLRMIGPHTDISRIKQAENQLIQTSKLASLGEISAGIAHEINNPLAIISGNIDLLPKYIENPEKLESKVTIIKKAIIRISKIVNGLKKFSRNSQDKNHTPHNLSQIIKEAIILTESKSNNNNVKVSYDVSNTESLINCDEIEIEQVLVNFISNAVDAIKNNIEKWVRIEQLEEDNFLIVKITDSGTGIDPAIAKKIFDPFFTTKAVGEGTGLGLSISKGILDSHKATISILENNPNTCFEIRFPKIKIEEKAA